MKVKAYNYLSQIALAFLPALLVVLTAREDLHLAAEMSFAFAVVGVIFSIFYLGQRPYVSIHGFLLGSKNKDVMFRVGNLIVATVLIFLISAFEERMSWAIGLAISVKFSEAFIDLRNGFDVYQTNVQTASRRLFVRATLRAGVIILGVMMLWGRMEGEYSTLIFICLVVALLAFVDVLFDSDCVSYKLPTLMEYRSGYKKLSFFSIATLFCSVLSAAPRFVLSPSSTENQIALVALSAAPVFAVLFQALWLSSISKLKELNLSTLLIFFAELSAVVILIVLAKPIWLSLVSILYGIEDVVLLDVFSSVVIAMSLFFPAMTLMNIFKYHHAWGESLGYLLALLSILVCFYAFGVDIIWSVVAAAAAMLFVFFIYIAFIFVQKKHAEATNI